MLMKGNFHFLYYIRGDTQVKIRKGKKRILIKNKSKCKSKSLYYSVGKKKRRKGTIIMRNSYDIFIVKVIFYILERIKVFFFRSLLSFFIVFKYNTYIFLIY